MWPISATKWVRRGVRPCSYPILTSREINAISKALWPLIRRVYTLCERVELPCFALARKRALPPASIGSFLGSLLSYGATAHRLVARVIETGVQPFEFDAGVV